ncbi:AbrB/MazE/SpoVT family DNA-binding domain-containing protein, partial [Candidatus Pacearchaeota archaeon]|nr:AbrB/MazE/SpoVT family DNA-binding domain-containing protein [Candidatus Pacearchaeota archaeon]
MSFKIIRITDKGQISLPVLFRNEMNLGKGDEIIITKTEDSLILKKLKREDFSDLLKHSEKVAEK